MGMEMEMEIIIKRGNMADKGQSVLSLSRACCNQTFGGPESGTIHEVFRLLAINARH